jgi:hypothetical protein
MKNSIRWRWSLGLVVAILLSIACSGQSIIPAMPTFPPIPPAPGTSNVPTGSSPMSGDWQVNAEFGHFAFTVDPDGKNVTTATFKLSNWTCGGTTLTTELQSLSQWPIAGGQFGGNVNLNGSFHTMTIIGAYDESNKQFTGTWDEDAHGSVCSGTWESIARN